MKKFLTGLLLCTLFVTLGAAAAMAATYDDFTSVDNAVASADYLDDTEITGDDIVTALTKLGHIDEEIPGYSVEFEYAVGNPASDDFEPATRTFTFDGELDEVGAFTDVDIQTEGTLYATCLLVSSADVAEMGLSSNDFFYVYADGTVVASGDVADGIAVSTLLAEDGVPLFPAKQVITLVFEENEDSGDLRTWFSAGKFDLVFVNQNSWATEDVALDKAAKVGTEDEILLDDGIVAAHPDAELGHSPFKIFYTADGALQVKFQGEDLLDGNGYFNDPATIEMLKALQEHQILNFLNLVSGTQDTNPYYDVMGILDDIMALLGDEDEGMVYFPVMVEAPFFSGEEEEILPDFCSLYLNGELVNYVIPTLYRDETVTPVIFLFVPIAVREETSLLGGTSNLFTPYTGEEMDFELIWQYDGPTYRASTLSVSYAADVPESEIEPIALKADEVSSDDLLLSVASLDQMVNNNDALGALFETETPDYMGGFELSSGDVETILVDSPDLYTLEFTTTASSDLSTIDDHITPVLTLLEKGVDENLRFDIFLSDTDLDALSADVDGDPTLKITLPYVAPAEGETFKVTMMIKGVETNITEYEGVDVDEETGIMTITFTRDGEPSFEDLRGTIFSAKVEGSEPTPTPTGSSSGGCSVGSFAPFALLLLAPLSLLRK